MSTHTMKKLAHVVPVAILGTLTLTAAAVCSADSPDVAQVVVRYDDLNMASQRGAARLYGRIDQAAHEVCSAFDDDGFSLFQQDRFRECIHKAVKDAVTKARLPVLTAFYNAKTGERLSTTVLVARASRSAPRAPRLPAAPSTIGNISTHTE